MSVRYSLTKEGEPCIEVKGGKSGGESSGVWVIGRHKARLKKAYHIDKDGRVMVTLEPGDTIFRISGIPYVLGSAMFHVEVLNVRRFGKNGLIIGVEADKWIPAEAIPYTVRFGVSRKGKDIDGKHFVYQEPKSKKVYSTSTGRIGCRKIEHSGGV
jgi:hypothetical protein